MSLPGGEDDDEHVGGSRGNAGGRGSGYFSNEQLEALANLHSGLAQITVQEWAVLLRCKAFRPVEADELVKSLIDWFGAPLSAGEISEFISRMVTEGFLARFYGGESFQTTALGHEVLEQSQRPIMRAALWMFQNKDEEGDRYVDR